MSEEQDGPILHESVRPQTIPAECYQLKLSRGGEEVTRQAHNLEIDSSILSPATSYR